MRRFFDMDSPLMRALTVLANLILLNFLFLVCSLPVFTIGASATALHKVTLQMIRKEDPSIIQSYLEAFRENFKDSTKIWGIFLLAAGGIAAEFYAVRTLPMGTLQTMFYVMLFVLVFLWWGTFLYVFALQARYENSLKATIRNALFMGVAYLPYTVVLFSLILLPVGMVILAPEMLEIIAFIAFLCGSSLIVYGADLMINRIFIKSFESERQFEKAGGQL